MNWYKILLKLSQRGNIELMNNPFGLQDPYRRKKKPEEGYDLNRVGDEDTSPSIWGTRFRGPQSPSGFQDKDDYELQRKNDIPSATFMFVDDHDKDTALKGEGVDTQFEDERDSPFLSDKLKGEHDPIGPHNMPNEPLIEHDVFNRVRKQMKGK